MNSNILIEQNFTGQNISPAISFAGQKFRLQAEVSPLMSGEILSKKVCRSSI